MRLGEDIMKVGNQWLKYLGALAASLPAASIAAPTAAAPAASDHVLAVSPAAQTKLQRHVDAARLASVSPNAQGGPWMRVTWIEEWERFYQNSGSAAVSPASVHAVPSLAKLLDDVSRNT
jgi:hypothetical protein